MSFKYKTILVGIVLLAVILILLLILSFSSNKQSTAGKTTTVIIETEPKDATVIIQDKRINKKAPVTLSNIPVGYRLTIRVSAASYNEIMRTIAIKDYPMQVITLNLSALREQEHPGYDELDKHLVPTIKPSYLQKIKEQPFWEMLPHYDPSKHFFIEYKDSDDKIVITTFGRGQVEFYQKDTLVYRQEALTWLQANGAKLNQLTIEYNPSEL